MRGVGNWGARAGQGAEQELWPRGAELWGWEVSGKVVGWEGRQERCREGEEGGSYGAS